jgi:hypothetical protein
MRSKNNTGTKKQKAKINEDGETFFKVMLVPEFESAMLGIARHNGNMVAVYDMNACIDIMVADGMKPGCAVRYLTSKIDNEYNEDHCPAFVVTYSDKNATKMGLTLNGKN